MADTVSKIKRREIMQSVRSKDSKIEIAFRKVLWQAGYRYRKNVNDYFGKPDIVLKKYRTVIFIDSCFWHGCPKHLRVPKSNVDYWSNKIKKNKQRDEAINREYKNSGWQVVRIWEHDIKTSLEETMRKLAQILDSRHAEAEPKKGN